MTELDGGNLYDTFTLQMMNLNSGHQDILPQKPSGRRASTDVLQCSWIYIAFR